MTRASKIIIGLALFAVVVPLLGFPGVVKDGLMIIVGLALAAITYWAEKHARFCPECKISDPSQHNHSTGERVFIETGGQKNQATSSGISLSHITPSVGADIVPRAVAESFGIMSPKVTPKSSPSPFSFDAETPKAKTTRRGGRKKETIVSQ